MSLLATLASSNNDVIENRMTSLLADDVTHQGKHWVPPPWRHLPRPPALRKQCPVGTTEVERDPKGGVTGSGGQGRGLDGNGGNLGTLPIRGMELRQGNGCDDLTLCTHSGHPPCCRSICPSTGAGAGPAGVTGDVGARSVDVTDPGY